MAKKVKLAPKSTESQESNVVPQGMTDEQIIMEFNKLVDQKLVILITAFDLAAKDYNFTVMDYLRKSLNFVEAELQVEGQPKRYIQIIPEQQPQVANAEQR